MGSNLKEIAQKVGISIASVSIYLSNPDTNRVSASTKEKIDQATEELNYRKNLFASSLSRHESRVIGGMGVCGRGYCCHSLTDKLNPVSIKMAKKQNLSLNSLKISGPCGRLLCCLAYEYDYYKEVKDKLPSEGSRIHFEGENCRVIEIFL